MRRVILMLTLAAITAVLLALGAGGASAKDPIYCESGTVCKGTGDNDTIIGSPGNDNIRPGFGDDYVYANEGDDAVGHSGGDDYIEGGDGADTLRGGFGHDTIYGNKPSTTDPTLPPADAGDGDHDLIDCAYLSKRKDTGPDDGFGEDTDTVVDCLNRDDQ